MSYISLVWEKGEGGTGEWLSSFSAGAWIRDSAFFSFAECFFPLVFRHRRGFAAKRSGSGPHSLLPQFTLSNRRQGAGHRQTRLVQRHAHRARALGGATHDLRRQVLSQLDVHRRSHAPISPALRQVEGNDREDQMRLTRFPALVRFRRG